MVVLDSFYIKNWIPYSRVSNPVGVSYQCNFDLPLTEKLVRPARPGVAACRLNTIFFLELHFNSRELVFFYFVLLMLAMSS